ncbi:hypothetical protein METBIDRAFT_82809 [Metschnikowia bicuspidata var. bicuspidata NRRL YB-4993]|uniref:NTF2 domain-containing protein n=1 Tax=Metschnikowia bicuspidata var. bicuspidata NRRL YB-4993 TaxID=869754 RepID=A0A1A0HAX4_9ASCO|nr:hypothetical protein METBIDRAFT_82809 [Metschnikowia bicuspidata var. bicuspidata NRRL YB-4993]OBA21145.1 hypothetical protein METBIDRAFT_82809 [Metschnikowia bicuspidata var. bicuspidata NRRL YB-4993]
MLQATKPPAEPAATKPEPPKPEPVKSVAPAEAVPQPDLSSEQIGWMFLKKYYGFYTADIRKLYAFYDSAAALLHDVFPGNGRKTVHVARGSDAVRSFFDGQAAQASAADKNKIVVESATFQASVAGAILIVVAGGWKRGVSPFWPFVQTFVLREKSKTVYDVANDVLTFVDLAGEPAEAAAAVAERVAEPSAKPVQASEPQTADQNGSSEPAACTALLQKEAVLETRSEEPVPETTEESSPETSKEPAPEAKEKAAPETKEKSAPETKEQPASPEDASSSAAETAASAETVKPADQEKPDQKQTDQEKPGQEKTDLEKPGQEKTDQEKPDQEQSAEPEKPSVPPQKPTWANLAAIGPKTNAKTAAVASPAAIKIPPPPVPAFAAKKAASPSQAQGPSPVNGKYKKEEWYPIFIRNVDVDEDELKAALVENFGEMKYFKKTQKTALCDFRRKEDQQKALEQKEMVIKSNVISLEVRVHKAYNGKPDPKKDKKHLKKIPFKKN